MLTEVVKWAARSCSRLQSATENGVGDCRSNLLVITLYLTHTEGSTSWTPLVQATAHNKSRVQLLGFDPVTFEH